MLRCFLCAALVVLVVVTEASMASPVEFRRLGADAGDWAAEAATAGTSLANRIEAGVFPMEALDYDELIGGGRRLAQTSFMGANPPLAEMMDPTLVGGP